jgi:hypothetical protein
MKDKDVISAKERLNAKRAKKIGKQQTITKPEH